MEENDGVSFCIQKSQHIPNTSRHQLESAAEDTFSTSKTANIGAVVESRFSCLDVILKIGCYNPVNYSFKYFELWNMSDSIQKSFKVVSSLVKNTFIAELFYVYKVRSLTKLLFNTLVFIITYFMCYIPLQMQNLLLHC